MNKKSLVLAVMAVSILLIVFLLAREEEQGQVESVAVQEDAADAAVRPVKEDQGKTHQPARAVPMEKGDIEQRLQDLAVTRHGSRLDDELIEELSSVVMELSRLTQQARQAADRGEEPYGAESQLRFMTLLIEGEQAFQENLGIGLSDFLKGLDKEELTELLIGE